MKKKVLYISLPIIIIVLLLSLLILNDKNNNKGKTFMLEEKYYDNRKIEEINFAKLDKLINDKESFVIFIYQPSCIISSDFEKVLNEFLKENMVHIYKIAFSDIKDTSVGKYVKYYPSFIIYNKGKVVDFLEANKDEDVNYYSSKDEFTKWFTKYVNLKDNKNDLPNKNIEDDNNSNNDVPQLDYDALNINLDNVIKEEGKVNIYFFWGDGCPHCEEEFKFFEEIKNKYGDYYNLYTYETWYNKDNAKLLDIFAFNMNDKVRGVPYTIIGNKSFKGFSSSHYNAFINAIETERNNSYDVYFDKIKK